MNEPPGDELDKLVALTDAKLHDLAQSGAMRSDPYRLALGVLVSVVQVLAGIVRRVQPGEMSPADREATRAALIKAAGQEGKVLVRHLHRRTATSVGLAVAGAFLAGVLLTAAAGYGSDRQAGGAGPAVLPGDAMLCQASGVRQDTEGRKFYPALNVRLEAAGRR